MSHWKILGIERTTDTSIIRKAYKQQLLIYHPEDDPTGYQAVRTAYAAAMNEAKRLDRPTDANIFASMNTTVEAAADADEQARRLPFSVDSVDLSEDDSEQGGGHEDEEHIPVTRRHFTTEVHDRTQAVNDFMTRLARLYNDQNQRNDPEAWTELLSDDALWDIQSKLAINGEMLQFFSEQHGLNNDIWRIIENHIGLFENITKNSNKYSPYFVDTYVLATQKIAVPSSLKQVAASNVPIIKMPRISWWRYCFRIPELWISSPIAANIFVVPTYLIAVLARGLLFFNRRNWKIIMWEYTFTHVNSWGKRYDFKYIDIIKIFVSYDIVIVYMENKKIRINAHLFENINQLLSKMRRYGRTDGDTIIVRKND